MKVEDLLTEQSNIETDKRQPERRNPDPEEAGMADPEDTNPSVESQLSESEQLQLQLQDANNRALRAQADLDNFRKRSQREQEQERRYATTQLLQDLLPMVDNIQRAIEAAEQSQQAAGLLEGFKLVAQQLQTILSQHHCTPISALGQPFDPNLHEAVSQLASDQYPQGTVMVETAVGYQLHDRVVRPSQVVVSTGPAEG